MDTPTKSNDPDGYLPNTGFITEKEIAKRLKKRDSKNLRRALIEKGVDHVVICETYLFKLDSFDSLFFED